MRRTVRPAARCRWSRTVFRAALIACFSVPACALHAQQDARAPTRTYTVVPDASRPRAPVLTIDEESGCTFNRISGMVIQAGGNVVVANAGNNELCIFTPAGKLVRRVGRGGSGPGEFRGIRDVWLLRGDSLLLYDDLLQRFSVHTPEGTFARSFNPTRPAEAAGFTALIQPLRDGSLLLGYSDIVRTAPQPRPMAFTASLFRHRGDGAVIGRVGRVETGEHFVQEVPRQFGGVAYWNLAFGRNASMASFGTGYLFAEGGSFDIVEYSADGARTMTHRIALQARPVSEADRAGHRRTALARAREEQRAMIERMVSAMPYPQVHAAIRGVLTDDAGGIWVEVHSTRSATPEWLRLSPRRGSTLAFALRDRFTPMFATRSRLCGVRRDEFDVEAVACFAIEVE